MSAALVILCLTLLLLLLLLLQNKTSRQPAKGFRAKGQAGEGAGLVTTGQMPTAGCPRGDPEAPEGPDTQLLLHPSLNFWI